MIVHFIVTIKDKSNFWSTQFYVMVKEITQLISK